MQTQAINADKFSFGAIHLGMAARRAVRWFAVITLILAASLCASAQANDPCTVKLDEMELTKLIRMLDDNSFSVRQRATADLEKCVPKLTLDNVITMVKAYNNGESEGRRRLDKILENYFLTYNAQQGTNRLKEAANLLSTRLDGNPGKLEITFKFGSLQGQTKPSKVFTDLVAKWNAYRDRVRVNDTVEAMKRLGDLKAFLLSLPPNDFQSLNLMNGNKRVKPEDLESLFKKAEDLLQVEQEEWQKKLQGIGDFPDPGIFKEVQVAGSGPVDVGKTLGLNIRNVVTSGTLEYSWSDSEFAYGPPPTGLVSYGPLFDMQADQNLFVEGTISVTIQYGDSQGNGYGITDPSQLAIIRIANGQYELLDSVNDLGSHTITGVYQVDSLPEGFDQFGEFMLVGPSYPGAGGVRFYQAGERSVAVFGGPIPSGAAR